MTSTSRGALDGILVADFSRVLAGPYLSMLLGDLGADVVKVEGPDGDPTRHWGPPWHGGSSTYYQAVNRNKRAMSLDLRDADEQALARELAMRADVLIENFLPGRVARFGLGYEDLVTANPRLIYCSISGFGSQSGGSTLPGYDILGQALSGMMSITGPPGGAAYKVGVAIVDVLCGLHGAVAVLAALAERARTGHGQRVEVDLLSSALSALTNQAAGFLLAGVIPQAMGNAHPSVAPYETVPTRDGEIVLAVGSDAQFRRLVQTLGEPALAEDARFSSNAARVEHRGALTERLTALLENLSRDAAVVRLRGARVPCGAVNDLADAFAFAEAIGLQPTWNIAGGLHVRAPMRMSAAQPAGRTPPPGLDEHGEELRRWLRVPSTPAGA